MRTEATKKFCRKRPILLALVVLQVLILNSGAQNLREGSPEASRGNLAVTVKRADGRPMAGVTVVRVGTSTNALIDGTNIIGGDERYISGDDGLVKLTFGGSNDAVVVACPAGFGLAQTIDLRKDPVMIVRPWGRIEGTCFENNRPNSGRTIRYALAARFIVANELSQSVVFTNNRAVTDSDGRFTFDHVPPAAVTLSGRQTYPSNSYTFLKLVVVVPGGTNRVEIAGHGRVVVGRLVAESTVTNEPDFGAMTATLQPDIDVHTATLLPEVPREFDTAEKRPEWWRQWHQTEAGRLADEAYSRVYGVEIHSNGTFTAGPVQPGKYWLNGSQLQGMNTVVTLSEHFEIPTSTSDTPFDAGKMPLKPGVNLPRGAVAPDFKAETLDGTGHFRLSDCRGKYVLLEFWATWSKPALAEIAELRAAREDFKTNASLVIVSVSLDVDREVAKRTVREQSMTWPQAYLGDWSRDTVTPSYGIRSIPQIVLIGPDGRIVTGLRGPQIKPALAKILAP